jgi:hypothetical protein
MALAPADFYAYSRATGVSIPEDPEERAQLAPEVLEFRRNQLKSSQQESNPLAALGTAAAAVGALAGLGFGAARLLGRGRQIPKATGRSATAGVRQVDLGNVEAVRQASAATIPGASQPAPSKMPPSVAVDEEYQAFRPDPKEFISRDVAEARRQAATQNLLQAAQQRSMPYQLEIPNIKPTLMGVRYPGVTTGDIVTGELQYQAPSRSLSIAPEQLSLGLNTLTSIQNASKPLNLNQFNNAVESGTNQIINRENLQLQRLTDQEKVEEATSSFISQRLNNINRGYGPTRGELRVQMTEGQMDAFNRLMALSEEEALGPIPERTALNIGPEARITKTAAGGAIRGASPSYQIFTTEDRPRQLSPTAANIPPELGPDVPGSQRATGGYVPEWLSQATAGKSYSLPEGETGPSKQEIMYSALDRIRPEANEVTPGIGVYGIEPAYVPGAQSKVTGEYSEAAYRKPTAVSRGQQKRNPFSGLSDADIIRISESAPPAQAKAMQQQLAARRSVDVSRDMTRIMQSYPKEVAQQKLIEYVQTLRGSI